MWKLVCAVVVLVLQLAVIGLRVLAMVILAVAGCHGGGHERDSDVLEQEINLMEHGSLH